MSLYEQIGTDKEGNQLQFVDVIESEGPDLASVVEQSALMDMLLAAMPHLLTKREQFVVKKRYGLDMTTPWTQQQVAKALHISRSYVSRMEKHALLKLRNYLEP